MARTKRLLVPIAAAAKQLGVSDQALRAMIDRGAPVEIGDGGRQVVDVKVVRTWRATYQTEHRGGVRAGSGRPVRRRSSSSADAGDGHGANGATSNGNGHVGAAPVRIDRNEAERRLSVAKMTLAELDVAVREGSLLVAADAMLGWTRRLVRLERRLHQRAMRLAPQLAVRLGIGPEGASIIRRALDLDTKETLTVARERGGIDDDYEEPVVEAVEAPVKRTRKRRRRAAPNPAPPA